MLVYSVDKGFTIHGTFLRHSGTWTRQVRCTKENCDRCKVRFKCLTDDFTLPLEDGETVTDGMFREYGIRIVTSVKAGWFMYG